MDASPRELAGQVALVTGSAKNIGRAIDLALADAGAKVVVNALTSGEAAHEFAPFGVTANAVSPGLIDTVRGASAGALPSSIAGAGNLLGRKGKPEEIAALVRALCGPAGRYVTGQTICANGGLYFN